MRASANISNKQGVFFSVESLRLKIDESNKLLSKALYALYDLGCLSSPTTTTFDELSIKTILVNDYEDDVDFLCSNIDGSLKLETLRLKFASKMSKNKEFVVIVNNLYNYYKSKEDLESLHKTLSMVLNQNSNIVSMIPKVSVSESIISYRTQLPLTQRVVRDSIIAEEGYVIKRFSLAFIVYKALCQVVGIPLSTIKESVKNCKSIFIDGISLNEELEFIPLLLSGDLHLTSENGKLLSETVMSYYKDARDDIEITYGKTTFENTILIKSFKNRMAYIEKLREKLGEEKKECLVSQFDIYFQIKGITTVRPKELSTIGNYIVDHVNKTSLNKINSLHGYTGEFISDADCTYMHLKKGGIPTSLLIQSIVDGKLVTKEGLFYNITQLTNSDGSPLKSVIGNECKLNYQDLGYVLKTLKTNKSELRSFIYSKCNPVLQSELPVYKYKNIISDIAELLLKAECGITDCKYVADADTSDTLLAQACYEAELLISTII